MGVPDREWGERVAAAVVLKEGQGSRSAVTLKVPSRLLVLDALPHNAMGKVLKSSKAGGD